MIEIKKNVTIANLHATWAYQSTLGLVGKPYGGILLNATNQTLYNNSYYVSDFEYTIVDEVVSSNIPKVSHYLKQCWSSVRSSDIPLSVILQEKPQLGITKISFKIAYLKFYSYLQAHMG